MLPSIVVSNTENFDWDRPLPGEQICIILILMWTYGIQLGWLVDYDFKTKTLTLHPNLKIKQLIQLQLFLSFFLLISYFFVHLPNV